jgi:hypothetical protein
MQQRIPPLSGLPRRVDDQAHLFFGRQKETLEALACFDTRPGHVAVRWLEINGNSGSGKSSLIVAAHNDVCSDARFSVSFDAHSVRQTRASGARSLRLSARYVRRTQDRANLTHGPEKSQLQAGGLV